MIATWVLIWVLTNNSGSSIANGWQEFHSFDRCMKAGASLPKQIDSWVCVQK